MFVDIAYDHPRGPRVKRVGVRNDSGFELNVGYGTLVRQAVVGDWLVKHYNL